MATFLIWDQNNSVLYSLLDWGHSLPLLIILWILLNWTAHGTHGALDFRIVILFVHVITGQQEVEDHS